MNEAVLERLKAAEEVFWKNDGYKRREEMTDGAFTMKDIRAAEERLLKFAPLIERLFPETWKDKGIIESPVVRLERMQHHLDEVYGAELNGRLYMKRDDILPI